VHSNQRVWFWRASLFRPRRKKQQTWQPRDRELVHVVNVENIEVAIWARRYLCSTVYSVTLHQRYFWKLKQQYRTTTTIDAQRISLAVMALELAHAWILSQERRKE
jgi:hypothetical protein